MLILLSYTNVEHSLSEAFITDKLLLPPSCFNFKLSLIKDTWILRIHRIAVQALSEAYSSEEQGGRAVGCSSVGESVRRVVPAFPQLFAARLPMDGRGCGQPGRCGCFLFTLSLYYMPRELGPEQTGQTRG